MTAATRPRAVFDCNIYVQAISNAAGPSGRAFSLLLAGRIDIVVSRQILAELSAVLDYPAVRMKFPILTDSLVERFVTRLRFRSKYVRDVPHLFDYPRARQDEAYVDLALAAQATFLVSRDKDLLSLATDHSELGNLIRRRNHRLRILDPVAFLIAIEDVTGMLP